MGERTPQPIRHGVGIESHQITRVALSIPEPQLYFIPDLGCECIVLSEREYAICAKGHSSDFVETEHTTFAVGFSNP